MCYYKTCSLPHTYTNLIPWRCSNQPTNTHPGLPQHGHSLVVGSFGNGSCSRLYWRRFLCSTATAFLCLRYDDARRLRRLWWIAFCNPCTWVIPQMQTNNTALQAGRYAEARHLPCPGVQPTVAKVSFAQPALLSALHLPIVKLSVHMETSHQVGSGGDSATSMPAISLLFLSGT